MRSAGVVEAEIPADRGAGLGDRGVSSEVDLLVLDRSPEPLDEDVEAPGTLAVHADGDPVPGQRTGEGLAGELAALIVLKISGRPWRAKASSSASTQNAASRVIDSRQARTRRLNQSMAAAR